MGATVIAKYEQSEIISFAPLCILCTWHYQLNQDAEQTNCMISYVNQNETHLISSIVKHHLPYS